MSLPGASALGAGCSCPEESRMWMQRNDEFLTTMCARCNRTWHYCPIHRVEVADVPNYMLPAQCSCKKPWMPAKSQCPKCASPHFLKPFETTTTRICKGCRESYHVCPLDGNSVPGPGYPMTAREQTMCQCHNNPPFLGKGWGSAFA
jgi:hypothetical protein